MSSRANIVNFMEDQKSSQSGTLKAMPPYNRTPMDTPSKSVNAVDDENRNPNTLPVPVASTPPTLSSYADCLDTSHPLCFLCP
jgi:protein regulator of cytokinesis 1